MIGLDIWLIWLLIVFWRFETLLCLFDMLCCNILGGELDLILFNLDGEVPTLSTILGLAGWTTGYPWTILWGDILGDYLERSNTLWGDALLLSIGCYFANAFNVLYSYFLYK